MYQNHSNKQLRQTVYAQLLIQNWLPEALVNEVRSRKNQAGVVVNAQRIQDEKQRAVVKARVSRIFS